MAPVTDPLSPAEVATKNFAIAKPFPHAVLDGQFDDALVDRAWEEFPPPTADCWRTFGEAQERGKQECSSPMWHGQATRKLLGQMVSPQFGQRLERLTGLSDLRVDLVGGGMHQSPPGAHLDLHVDFNRHPLTGWHRVLNVLLFLNRGWPEDEKGGRLLLGKGDEQISVAPVANRLVIFRTSDSSWHGHPDPVPEGLIRRSLACYFYAPPIEEFMAPEHSTVWAD